MFVIISLECTLAQQRMGFGRVRGHAGLICLPISKQNPEVFIALLFSISISGNAMSYFIEMFMLISLECTLAQTRMGR